MDKSISSAVSEDSKEWSSELESDFSYDENDDTDEENEDETIESQRLIAIGVLKDDDSKAPETTIQDQQIQQQTASDEAVANSIAREEHSAKMRIKKERGALAQRRSKVNQSNSMSRSEQERREKMRTYAGRKRVPRSRPLRANPSEANHTVADSSKRSLNSTNDETIGSGGSVSQRSFSGGIDLDEKTRQRILARSALRYARPKRSSLGATNETDQTAQVASVSPLSSPSDEKRNTRTTPRMTGSSNSSTHQRRSSTQTSRPSDEKAAFRRRNNHPRRARAMRTTTISDVSPSEEGTTFNNNDVLELAVATDDSIDPGMENNPGNDVDVEAAEVSDDEEELEVLPGAFAVSGIGDDEEEPGVSGYDSGFENDSILDTEDATELGEDSLHDAETTGASTRMETSTAITTPLTAELYEVEAAVTAKVLTADGEDPESKRKIRKLKIRLSVAFLVSLLIVVTVVALVFTRRFRTSPQDGSDQEKLPVVTGWEPVGKFLSLETPYEDDIRFGNAVAISTNGNRIAVGLPGVGDSEDGTLKRAGSVHIFDLVNGTNWEENTKILGAYAGAELGTNVAISDDGKRVAIGAPSYNINFDEKGYVAIYEESNVTGQWTMAANFSGEAQERVFGESVAFAGNGRVIAIGDRYFDDRGLQDIGAVRLYQEVNGSWNEMGTAILGSKRGDRFGWSVSLSKDGNRVAASSLGVTEPGSVHIFDYNGTDWEMVGSSLTGESIRELFGFAVELSREGSVLAVSAVEYSREGQEESVGIVRSYQHNNGVWMEYGQPLEGENRQDAFGSSISLSSDGSTIAIGGPENGNFCNSCGQVKVFQMTAINDEFIWENVGSALGKADIDNGQFGYAVALSETGKRVVSGAPFTKFDGLYSKVGEVLVFDSIAGEYNSD